MSKKETIKFFKNYGFSSAYSGKLRTLFVHGISEYLLSCREFTTSFKVVAD